MVHKSEPAGIKADRGRFLLGFQSSFLFSVRFLSDKDSLFAAMSGNTEKEINTVLPCLPRLPYQRNHAKEETGQSRRALDIKIAPFFFSETVAICTYLVLSP